MENTKPLSRKLQVLFLSIGQFLTTIAGLVSSIALSRLLSIDEYANFRQTILVYAFITPILSLGFDKAIYYNFEKNKENHKQQIINVQYVILSLAIIIALFFIAGGNGLVSKLLNNSFVEKGVIIYSIFSIFNLPILLLQPILVIKQKVKLLTVFNIANKLLSVIVTVLVAYFYRDANSILISLLFVGIITFIIVEIIILKNTSGITRYVPDIKIINEYKYIGLPLVLASIMGVAGKNIDKLLISTMMTPADFAIYSNGAIEIPMIGAITGAVMAVILADFTKLLNQGKIKETFELWGKAVETTSSILIPIMFILLLNADWLIVAMYGDKYAESVIPFSIYLFLLPMRTMTFSSLITASGKTRHITYGALIFLIPNIILSIILMKLVGFAGPAIATVISAYISGFYLSYSIKKVNKVSFLDVFAVRKMLPYLVSGGLGFSLSYFLPKMDNLILNIFTMNVIFIVLFIVSIAAFGKMHQYFNLFKMFKR